MKTFLLPILIAIFGLLLMLFHISCSAPEAQAVRQIVVAGGLGYLEGGKAGAITGVAVEARRMTSDKQPLTKVSP